MTCSPLNIKLGLTNIDVVFSQSHQGEEEDVSVQTPDKNRAEVKIRK